MWLTEEQSYNLPPDKQGEVEEIYRIWLMNIVV